jgi:hypothetical protein
MCNLLDPKFFLPPVQFVSHPLCPRPTRPLHRPRCLRSRPPRHSQSPPPRFLLFLQCQTCPNTCAMLRRGVRVAPANLQCLLHLANLYAITTSPPHPASATADLCYPTASLSSTSTTTPLLPRPSSSPEVHTIISASCQLCHVC